MLSEKQVVFKIQNADPTAIEQVLRSALPDSTTILADPRTRSIMMVASPAVIERASGLIASFDTPQIDRHVQTFAIQYSKATDLAKPVTDALGLAPPYGVTAVPSANSLVVTGTNDALGARTGAHRSAGPADLAGRVRLARCADDSAERQLSRWSSSRNKRFDVGDQLGLVVLVHERATRRQHVDHDRWLTGGAQYARIDGLGSSQGLAEHGHRERRIRHDRRPDVYSRL